MSGHAAVCAYSPLASDSRAIETRTSIALPCSKNGEDDEVTAPTGSAGVMAVACMEEGIGRNTGSPAGGVARANRQPARVRLGW